ncbi:MAG: hypothetical protein R2759_14845 [Bacteroidales bacterium]
MRRKKKIKKNIVYRIGNAVSTTKDLSELITVIRLELNEVIDVRRNKYVYQLRTNTREISCLIFVDERDRFKRIPAGKSTINLLPHSQNNCCCREQDISAAAYEITAKAYWHCSESRLS